MNRPGPSFQKYIISTTLVSKMTANYICIDPSEIPFLAGEPLTDVHYEAISNWNNCDFNQITMWVHQNLDKLPNGIKDGDVIGFGELGKLYRNGSKCLWYGHEAHDLDYEDDEYGALPNAPELHVRPGHFHPRYWIDVIEHNAIYWVCDEYRHQCLENVEIVEYDDVKVFRTWYVHDGVKEYVVYNQDYVEEEDSDETTMAKFIHVLKSGSFNCVCDDLGKDDMTETNTSSVNGPDVFEAQSYYHPNVKA